MERNRSGPKSRSYTTRIEQEAVDRRSEFARVNVRDGAGSNKGNGPRSRSYIKRSGQRPPGVSVTERPKVISCDRAAKVVLVLPTTTNLKIVVLRSARL